MGVVEPLTILSRKLLEVKEEVAAVPTEETLAQLATHSTET